MLCQDATEPHFVQDHRKQKTALSVLSQEFHKRGYAEQLVFSHAAYRDILPAALHQISKYSAGLGENISCTV